VPTAIRPAGFRQPPRPNLLVDASLYVGEQLRAAMGFNYPTLIEEIAGEAEVPVGRLAVRPLHLDRQLSPWAWRIIGPKLRAASR
jgi:hypothetical protein